MNRIFFVVIFLYFMLSTPIHAADMYKWVDRNGVYHVSDKPAPPDERVEVIKDATPDAPPDTRKAEIAQELYRLNQQLAYHAGNCLKQKSADVCKKGEELDRKDIESLNADPDRYFKDRGK